MSANTCYNAKTCINQVISIAKKAAFSQDVIIPYHGVSCCYFSSFCNFSLSSSFLTTYKLTGKTSVLSEKKSFRFPEE